MTDHTISPLRRRMIDDMTIRGFASKTQRGYVRAVRDFAGFLGCSPDRASAEYQLHMRSAGVSATSRNAAVSGLRFFFGVTLGRDDAVVGMSASVSTLCQRGGESTPCEVTTHEAEGNCVIVRWGGEQPEANGQPWT